MSRRFLQRGVAVLCMLAGVLVLSASRNTPTGAAELSSAPVPQRHQEPLLDIPLPFEETVECYVNGEKHMLVVHRRIRLFFFPVAPLSGPVRWARVAEECE